MAFVSLGDFAERCAPSEAEYRALLDSGAFDGFNRSRPEMFWQLRRTIKQGATPRGILWELSGTADMEQMPPIELTRPTAEQIAARETDLLGFPVTVDPLTHLGR